MKFDDDSYCNFERSWPNLATSKELINFYSVWNHHKTKSFWVIPGGIEDNKFTYIWLIRRRSPYTNKRYGSRANHKPFFNQYTKWTTMFWTDTVLLLSKRQDVMIFVTLKSVIHRYPYSLRLIKLLEKCNYSFKNLKPAQLTTSNKYIGVNLFLQIRKWEIPTDKCLRIFQTRNTITGNLFSWKQTADIFGSKIWFWNIRF